MKQQYNLNKILSNIFCLIILLISLIHQALADEPLPIGIFSLPGSQIPATLLGFGQFTIDKNQQHFFVQPIYVQGENTSSTAFEFQYVKGLTDRLSFMLALPYSAHFKEDMQTSAAGHGRSKTEACSPR